MSKAQTELTADTAVMQLAKPALLKVPGARIYYEVRGTGPLLLMIPGGPADAGVFAELSRCLAHRYTTVTYDPRGNSRSTFDGSPQEQELDVHGDDAAQLIEALGKDPVYVFGNSGGAQIGLNLAARHPERVRVLVAHEPPCLLLLADPSAALAVSEDVYDTYRRDGVGPAMAKFFSANGIAQGPEPQAAVPLSPEAAATFARVTGNFEYWLAHGRPLALYRPDIAALRSGQPRIVVGIGEESAGQTIYRVGLALAEKLDVAPVFFPGDHMAFASHPATFAETLSLALQ
jgi:pimeloyl-ACP methyl ester carboxylesterase